MSSNDRLADALRRELATTPGMVVSAIVRRISRTEASENLLRGRRGAHTFSAECVDHGPPNPELLDYGISVEFARRAERLGRVPEHADGPRYYVSMGRDGEDADVNATLRDASMARDLVLAWCDGASVDALRAMSPEVDRRRRELERLRGRFGETYGGHHAFTVRLHPTSRRIGGGLTADGRCVWVHGPDGFACEVDPLEHDDALWCGLRVEGNQVASVLLDDEARLELLVECWVEAHASRTELTHSFPGANVSLRASEDYMDGRWSWDDSKATWEEFRRDLLEDDSFFPNLLPVVEYILERPAMHRFYNYTSLTTLCFSRCSHYPFETTGLPTLTSPAESVYPEQHPTRWVIRHSNDDVSLFETMEEALDALESILSADTSPTWHGSSESPLARDLNEALSNLGSRHRVAYRNPGYAIEGTDVSVLWFLDDDYCQVRWPDEDHVGFPSREDAAEWIVEQLAAAEPQGQPQ